MSGISRVTPVRSGMLPRLFARGLEARPQALGQLGVQRGEIDPAAIAEREQTARVQNPLLETQRRADAEILTVAGDSAGEGFELVVPFDAEEELIGPAEEPCRRQAVEFARLEKQDAAVLLVPDAFGPQAATHRRPLGRALGIVQHRDG